MTKRKVIHWFRQDLRLSDNPALSMATKNAQVLPIYILDDINAGKHSMGAASRWWLHHSLTSLHQSLNLGLCCYKGNSKQLLLTLVKQQQIEAVYWNHCYEPWYISLDQQICTLLEKLAVKVYRYHGSLLWQPLDTVKKDGTPYKVFTPFYRNACLNAPQPRQPLEPPGQLELMTDQKTLAIDHLNLLPKINWYSNWPCYWQIGEKKAQQRLATFLAKQLDNYENGRNFPGQNAVSKLSPHLHFGEISPNQIWYAVKTKEPSSASDRFLTELGWREFSYNLLYHFPSLPLDNLQKKFDAFPWQNNQIALKRWQQGKTGYPIVDAAMRELWQTGYMHGRTRMIVGSFLVKNLLLHWHHGEAWFWNCLVDADLANNSASWQWIAGCGADAAPYFRIFNPISQGIKFDPTGNYTKQFVKELAELPLKYLFAPWEAPASVLRKAGVVLDKTYPSPMVELKASRDRALVAFASLKEKK